MPLIKDEEGRTGGSGIVFVLWLLCITFSLAGVQFVYSIQFAIGTPLFSEELKVDTSMISIIFGTAGPISGFIIQPLIGAISDGCTSPLGRRRPFILAGAIICALAMALIGYSVTLGNMLGDIPDGQTSKDHKIALILAIIGLWLMNFCVNIIQGPARAIVADIVAEDKQQAGNAMVAGVMGLAAIVANLVGAQFFGKPQPYRTLFLIGLSFVLLSVVPTMIVGKERALPKKQPNGSVNQTDSGDKVRDMNVFAKIIYGFRHMPKPMIKVAVLYFFSWCAFTPFMVDLSNYFGQNVYDGTNDVALYQKGIKFALYALAIFAGVQWIFSLILPAIIRVTNTKVPFFITQVIATACYVLFLFFPRPIYVPIILTAALAPNFVTFNSIPFAIVAESASRGDAGLYMGVLNSASVVAQTVTNLLAGVLLKYKHNNVAWGIAFGAIFSVIACLLVFIIEKPKPTGDDEGEKEKLLPARGNTPRQSSYA